MERWHRNYHRHIHGMKLLMESAFGTEPPERQTIISSRILNITKTGKPVNTYAEFQDRPASQRRPKADAGSYELPILLHNGTDGGNTTVTVKLAKGNAAHINNFEEGTVVFENTISNDFMSKTLPLTITDIYMSVPDTLRFEITSVVGGSEYPTPGPKKFFDLIIRPSGLTNVDDFSTKKITLSPNPVINKLQIISDFDKQAFAAQIFDITGKVVYTNNQLESSAIDVSFLRNGIYFIRLTGIEGTITQKFVKQ
jgi:hypothetical protein